MAIPTSRTKAPAEILIKEDICTGCGLCVSVCKDFRVIRFGSCMLGAVHPFIQNGGKAKQFRETHGIKCASREGIFVIFGYPAVKYNKGINRTFASETYQPDLD